MAEHFHVHFSTTGPAADRQLIREYVLDAVERLPDMAACERVGFVPAGHKPGVDGLVILEVFGGQDAIVVHERGRWDELIDTGLAEDWETVTDVPDPTEYYGENGADLRARLSMLAARLSRLVFDEFDEPPDPVDEHPEEAAERATKTGTGWWTLLHCLTLHQAIPYEQEVEAYAEGIRDALIHLAEYRERDAVEAKLDEVTESLEAIRREVRQVADNRDG